MTVYVSVYDEKGNPLGFEDIPIHCQADECPDFIDLSKPEVRMLIPNWKFRMYLNLCPRHLGMAVGMSKLLETPDA